MNQSESDGRPSRDECIMESVIIGVISRRIGGIHHHHDCWIHRGRSHPHDSAVMVLVQIGTPLKLATG